MSVFFGRWNYDSASPAPGYLEKASQLLAPYGPDGEGRYSGGGVDIIYRAFHTTKESRREKQPHAAPSGAVIAWDGRLDNREELIGQLRGNLSIESTDVAIAAAAYEKWGTESFGKLMGDWALAIWNPRDQALILAKDFVGTRHLYYAIEKDQVTWSSILDPLVLLAGKPFALEEEYIAGWLAFFPATHLTPYVGIQAVPPSTFVRVSGGKQTVRKYWDFDPRKRIRYRTDAEYEEHFRSVFRESVRRRLRSDTPVLAELSGGMDSSSIVCMADKIIEEGFAETPRLDTVSYYDDREPNWNERPYFTKVEEKRGRTGCHIDVGSVNTAVVDFQSDRVLATPGNPVAASKASERFEMCIRSQGNRVLLRGVGGDEVLGGVPTPIPELADLFAMGQFKKLAQQVVSWAIVKRKPVLRLLCDVIRVFLPVAFVGLPQNQRPASWLKPEFVRRNRTVFHRNECRLRMIGRSPSFQENVHAFHTLCRQLSCSSLPLDPTYGRRYPYLDRDLLEFVFAIPREQLLRPGQRRSLMRRSLVGTVPDDILGRRRKAYVVRGICAGVLDRWPVFSEISHNMISASAGMIDSEAFRQALLSIPHGRDVPIVFVARTIAVEAWLRQLVRNDILIADWNAPRTPRRLRTVEISAERS